MRKGQKVRVLADGRVGIVADSHFFSWGGKRMVQYQVRFPDTKGEAPWFPAEQLTTDLVQKTTVVIESEKGKLFLTYLTDHDTLKSRITLTGEPENLAQHKGPQVFLANALLDGLRHKLEFTNRIFSVE